MARSAQRDLRSCCRGTPSFDFAHTVPAVSPRRTGASRSERGVLPGGQVACPFESLGRVDFFPQHAAMQARRQQQTASPDRATCPSVNPRKRASRLARSHARRRQTCQGGLHAEQGGPTGRERCPGRRTAGRMSLAITAVRRPGARALLSACPDAKSECDEGQSQWRGNSWSGKRSPPSCVFQRTRTRVNTARPAVKATE